MIEFSQQVKRLLQSLAGPHKRPCHQPLLPPNQGCILTFLHRLHFHLGCRVNSRLQQTLQERSNQTFLEPNGL